MKEKFALGVLMGCLITGNIAWAADFVTSGAKLEINNASESVIVNDTAYNLIANMEEPAKNGIWVKNDGALTVNSSNINIDYSLSNTTNDVGWRRAAVNAMAGGNVVLGNAKTESVNITAATDNDIAVGLSAWRNGGVDGGSVTVNAGSVNIDVKSDKYWAYGIMAFNATQPNDNHIGKRAEVVINAADTVINATGADGVNSRGIIAWSEAKVKINEGNLTINAEHAINTRGSALVEINKKADTHNVIKLNGDIVFEYNKYESGTPVESNVVINLNNNQSYLNGNIYIDGNPPAGKDEVTGMNLGLSNGGTWNTDGNSFVNNLTFDGGVINVNGGADQTIQIDNVAGNGGDINIKGELDNGVWKLGKVALGKDDTSKVEGKIDLNLSGVTADDIEDSKAALDALAGSLSVNGNDNKLDATGNIQEGLISGGISSGLNVDENGKVSVDESTIQQSTSTTTMDSMRDIAGVAIAAWRQEDSSLGQRLGELRSSEGDQGIWTRMSRGEFEYNGNFKNQYNFFQLGYDKANGDWHYGAAISHNDGKTNYANGSGENSSTSLSLYGTWLGNDGEYADIVLKQGRLNNEFDIVTAAGRTNGDYDMWGTSLSGEYGKEIKLNDGWYVTPQGQLTLMYIGGEDYTTNNGIRAEQDSMTSLVGRVGFEMGKAVSDKGRIFAKASLLHDFNGEADTRLTLGDKHNSYTQDLGETWYEAGIGISYKVSKASYIYADVMKTFGGDLETPWQWNAGVRYSF